MFKKKKDDIDKELAASHRRVPISMEVRQALHAKRLGFGLSYSGAAELIGVHWSTYRKWEIGQTTIYTREIERHVKIFLEEQIGSINPSVCCSQCLLLQLVLEILLL